jgi:hypothetical protein
MKKELNHEITNGNMTLRFISGQSCETEKEIFHFSG